MSGNEKRKESPLATGAHESGQFTVQPSQTMSERTPVTVFLANDSISALQNHLMTDYINRCNAISSLSASSQLSLQISTGNHNQPNANFQSTQHSSYSPLDEINRQQLLQQKGKSIASPFLGLSSVQSIYHNAHLERDNALRQVLQQVQNELQQIQNTVQHQQQHSSERGAEPPLQAAEALIDHKPNYTYAPCPAKCMPHDHNSKNAYFTIAENICHGDELICSYFDCQKVGIKFRYCAFCKGPVPKRKFSQIHSQCDKVDKKPKPKQKPQKKSSNPVPVAVQNAHCMEISGDSDTTANKSRNRNSLATLHTHLPLDKHKQKEATEKSQEDSAKASRARRSRIRHISNAQRKKGEPEDFEEDRLQSWDALLSERPHNSDANALSEWITKALRVSERSPNSDHSKERRAPL